LLPKYTEVTLPLLRELYRLRGRAQAKDMYKVLADFFHLTEKDLSEVIYEKGKARSKWENMVRTARRELVDKNLFKKKDKKGWWEISNLGLQELSEDAPNAIYKDVFNVRKISYENFEKSEKNKKEIGLQGELWVIEFEKTRLAQCNPSCVKKIKHIGLEDVAAGYDIISYDEFGQEIYIEVKTTTTDEIYDFYITKNEIEFARRNKNHKIYRLIKFNESPELIIIDNFCQKIDHELKLIPLSWKVSSIEH
jgi:hypothetical protein